VGRGRGAGPEQERFFGKACASGEDVTRIEEAVRQRRAFTTLFR